MDYQKPVKVKSRWTQSCQMEMMMEESQSSLDMSDAITDVSNSDLNESTDYSFELKSVELRRSRRNGNSRTDYRQLIGLKAATQKKPVTSKTINKRGRKKKQPLNTFKKDKEDKLEENIQSEDYNECSIDWNNITNFQSKKLSKSIDCLYKVEKTLQKSIRRASLSWDFAYTNGFDDNNCIQEIDNCNISNAIQHLNINETSLKITPSSVENKNICNDKLVYHENAVCTNSSQKLDHSNINSLNNRKLDEQNNGVLKIEPNEIFVSISNNQKLFETSNSSVSIRDDQKECQNNNFILPIFSSFEKNEIRFHSMNKLRTIRSKSVDSLMTKTITTLRHCKSYEDVSKLKNTVIYDFKMENSKKKSPTKKRRQSKRIKTKINSIELLDDTRVPDVDYNKVADEIYKEHKNQLLEARINDAEFDEKLKSTNFTLIDENLYRPNRQSLKLYPPSDISSLRKLKQRVISGDINDYCECTLSKEEIIEGNNGCDDQCLNRLLKVECGSGCSLKRYCTNKQFQNKQFKKTNIIKTENKGYGICAVEDIPKGVLISEYVGEVIDYNEMCNRLEKKEYENLNYMVQLNPDEIIDSTSKGNVTRFINHSCDPNAVGEKWHVLGQSRIGFFSTRPIKKGEEITFDYSFQIFGDGAQICYCGSSKCRGYINKKTQITGLSSSEDSDGAIENNLVSKFEEKQRKKRILKKRTDYNDKNKLRELRRQLTEIAKLKTGLKADQELATLNLNRLMVHITDSVSRLHVLTFIREHDMNKRLFMDFSGLSIIHNWMTSNENESFKLMILEILAELPITNRNTITKSKVLDVVAEWADIPMDVKMKIESLEIPTTDLQKHCQDIDNILPNCSADDETNCLVKNARALWKKWIVLKMVFKIPKKIDQHKSNEINSNKLSEDNNPSSIDRKTLKSSNKYVNQVQKKKFLSCERTKFRKEYKLKVEQNRQKMFMKKVLDDGYEKIGGLVIKKPDQKCLPTLNHSNNNSKRIVKQTRWDCSSQVNSSHLCQNSVANNSMQIPCLNSRNLNFIQHQQVSQQPLQQIHQYSYIQPCISSNHHQVNNAMFFNTPPPPIPNQPLVTRSLISTSLPPIPVHQSIEPLSPTKRLMKLAETNAFNFINRSLNNHCNNADKNKNKNSETEHSIKSCSKPIQFGADLLGRIKVISNSFKKQPSKLIKIKQLKKKSVKTKSKKVHIINTKLKSICKKNKKIVFINEQEGVTSNTLSKELMPTISLSDDNKFANAILDSLLKKSKLEKENCLPSKFILENHNSHVITCDETEKEIELYKNMKPKIKKKVVACVKTKSGSVAVVKRKWGIKLKGLKVNHEKIPATKRNLMRKGSIHRLALKNCIVNRTKSALKRPSSVNGDDCSKKPKEKRVTFLIEGEPSPIFPHSEVRPINLNQNTNKQKPLMKCHPFEIRSEPKSILQPSTSSTLGDNLQFSLPEQSFGTTNDQIISPIVAKFKASRNRRLNLRDKSSDLEQLRSQRKHMIPESMMSLSVDVLKLIPDNRKEMKKVIDYYHSMATVIVKTLGSYAKKTCQQGRIRSDEDFKYLAKKINENVLSKELQLKKVDKLKISNSTKDKVAEYIRKYMSRFGEVYKRKPSEQTNHHKTK